jgi:hypothetical protein
MKHWMLCLLVFRGVGSFVKHGPCRQPQALLGTSLRGMMKKGSVGEGLSRMADIVQEVSEEEHSVRAIAQITAISAPLGVLLDNQHGLFGVLEYNFFNVTVPNPLGHGLLLKSALWVPILFAFAGWIMSYIQIVTDKYFETAAEVTSPTPWKVLYGISMFSALYYLSGLLDYQQLLDPNTVNAILWTLAVAGYVFFDSTKAGLVLAIATAISGPVAEIALTSTGLYQYTHADLLKITSWICPIYFLGGPAVGNLARALRTRGIEVE